MMQILEQTLKLFTQEKLFNATSVLLEKLGIQFDREIAEPIDVSDLYDAPMPKYLLEALQSIENTYFIGVVNDLSLHGSKTNDDLESITGMIQRGDKYDGMFIFACDAKLDANLTRTASAALTRAFNRIACANPVILIIRQGDLLSLATCERMEYSRQWQQGTGQKLGKVNILRNINCHNPHRGHLNILKSLAEKQFSTFEALYQHWLTTFSNELLTKKFYSELSDWYAWAVQIARFPNDLSTREDDAKFNHEACIRLITRLIFVWFLKEKKLIPEEFFDEKYIRENLIDDFNPHELKGLFFFPEKSKYYRLVLQNLFFAMLNRPIVAEGKTTPTNRRFMRESFQGKNPDHDINNIMRYKKEFAEGGAEKFVKLANSNVPFLNGGLFECLDNKSRKIYYDGFSEHEDSIVRLYLPDYLFFGEEVGNDIDLSQWYGDRKKKNVSVRGIIEILKNYSFTIEENTPLDQEVSLDPELLGKVFENLLAAYNPETQTSARKQTGSFYTPRVIVQYMVDESLVAHLKRKCGEELEPEYRRLLSYATEETSLNKEQRAAIMKALYNCRVLDPACGSGAFPMGVLQQMVHVLRQIDPDNEMWHNFVIDRAIEKTKDAFGADDEEEREARLADIEEAFNRNINDPDYSRKLYLIENCIYGVDIQPIAVQISKLRFFISLVVDQNPTKDPKSNFAIRPLPNLESKFVAANTLIPLDSKRSLFTSTDDIRYYEKTLQELNHQLFLAKRNKDKQEIRQQMIDTRRMMAQTLENIGFLGKDGYAQLTEWNMFDQNASSSFFDPEWMFGVKDGFDIVIANPPYISIRTTNFDKTIKKTYKRLYSLAVGQYDLYTLFIEKGCSLLLDRGILTFIIPTRMLSNENFMPARKFVVNNIPMHRYVNALMPFDNVNVEANIMLCKKNTTTDKVVSYEYVPKTNSFKFISKIPYSSIKKMPFSIFPFVYDMQTLEIFDKIQAFPHKKLASFMDIIRGFECGYNDYCIGVGKDKLIKSEAIDAYFISNDNIIPCEPDFSLATKYKTPETFFTTPKLVTKFCANEIKFALDNVGYCNTNSVYNCLLNSVGMNNIDLLLAILNSGITTFWFNTAFLNIDSIFPHIQKNQLEAIPIPCLPNSIATKLVEVVNQIKDSKSFSDEHRNKIDSLLYYYYGLNYDEILIVDPNTTITREEYNL